MILGSLMKVDLPPPIGPIGLLMDQAHRRHDRAKVERSGTGGRIWRCCRFRGRRSVSQTAVRTDGVVMPSPCLYQHIGLGEAAEDLAIEQFVAKRAFEAFIITILP